MPENALARQFRDAAVQRLKDHAAGKRDFADDVAEREHLEQRAARQRTGGVDPIAADAAGVHDGEVRPYEQCGLGFRLNVAGADSGGDLAQHESSGGHHQADPLAPAQVEAEEALGEDREEDESPR